MRTPAISRRRILLLMLLLRLGLRVGPPRLYLTRVRRFSGLHCVCGSRIERIILTSTKRTPRPRCNPDPRLHPPFNRSQVLPWTYPCSSVRQVLMHLHTTPLIRERVRRKTVAVARPFVFPLGRHTQSMRLWGISGIYTRGYTSCLNR